MQNDMNEEVKKNKKGKKVVIFIIIALVGVVLGRLAARGVINLLVGGTLFGGNFL